MPLLNPGLLQLTLEPIERGWCVVPARLLFDHYATFVERLMVFLHGVATHDAPGVASDVFLRVLHTPESGFWPGHPNQERSPRAWLMRLAREEAILYRKGRGRRQKQRRLRLVGPNEPPRDPRQVLLERWRVGIEAVPRRLLEVFVLCDLENLPVPRVADLLEQPVETLPGLRTEAGRVLRPLWDPSATRRSLRLIRS